MNLRCGAPFCILAFVTVSAQRGSGPSTNRGLKLHSTVIEEAYLRTSATNGTDTKAVDDGEHKKYSLKKTLKGDDDDDEKESSLKKVKPLVTQKPPYTASDKESKKASSDKLKADVSDDKESDDDLKTKDGRKTDSKSKQKDSKQESPSVAPIKQAPKKQKSKGCRRLGAGSSGGTTTETKTSKGSKKIRQKGSSSPSKGSDKLNKSGTKVDNGDGKGNTAKNNSTYAKGDSDDYSYKKDKSKKYLDDEDECEEGTDPPEPSKAPSPEIPSSEEDIVIPLSPYFVLYEIQQTRIPLLTEYDELTNFTSGYLDNYFRSAFANMEEVFYVGSRTILIWSEFRLAQAVRIDYATNVTFTSTSLIPGTSELESITIGAFEGDNGVKYAAAAAAGLGANNIFSTTSAVTYALTEELSLPQSINSTRVESAIYAINAGLIALMVLVYRWRSHKGPMTPEGGKSLVYNQKVLGDDDDDKDEQQMRNIIEGWNAGIGPVLSSMKVSIASPRHKRSSRGFSYNTVGSSIEIKGAEKTSST